jgi:hypothetical protein
MWEKIRNLKPGEWMAVWGVFLLGVALGAWLG